MDFFKVIRTTSQRKGQAPYRFAPKFIVGESNDLMVRGGNFYAVWLEDQGRWSTNENDVIRMVDAALDDAAAEFIKKSNEMGDNVLERDISIAHMWDSDSGSIDKWHKYVQKQQQESYKDLDSKLVFANDKVKKTDYATKRLPYALEEGDTSAWDEMLGTLYSEEDKHKIEWAIGAVVSGGSKKLQKFFVLYGGPGTGKSTVLNIMQMLFEGYWVPFVSSMLGRSTSEYSLEQFKDNPLVAIEHDGDLSRLDDNTKLNSLVSHETIVVNQKYSKLYSIKPHTLLFMGTNKPVNITDGKSGLIRRLVDIFPTGERIHPAHYNKLYKEVSTELGAIAYKCKNVFLANPNEYDNYKPTRMMRETNDLYNFVEDRYDEYVRLDTVSLGPEWAAYKTYCEDANVKYPLTKKMMRVQLADYFKEYKERTNKARDVYIGFKREIFEKQKKSELVEDEPWLVMKKQHSLFDDAFKDRPAQYAVEDEKSGQIRPEYSWAKCKTTLTDILTSKLHYVSVPENLIVIDFDIKGEDGSKNFDKNLAEALKWPPTYAEVSKSGSGIHLHYYYDGDINELSNVYDDNIEIKVFPADKKAALRRKVSLCNTLPIAHISTGLPKKEVKKMVNGDAVKSEKGLRKLIERNLNKEIHPATKPSIDFIYKILDDAYNSGLQYDVSDMKQAVLYFAGNSSHQAGYCMDLVSKMRFKSDDISPVPDSQYDDPNTLVFFDIEVFPNLLLVCYAPVTMHVLRQLTDILEKEAKLKKDGKKFEAKRTHQDFIETIELIRPSIKRLINPKPDDIQMLCRNKLVGYNCRRYDNHVLYAAMNGYSPEQCYKLSQAIVNKRGNPFFGNAYDLSYTDVYDFSSKKQKLKEFEIDLGMTHIENEYPWDEPLSEEHWEEVGDYCCNDVLATIGTFCDRYGDYVAREILSAISGLNMNATTNMHTTRIIFGKNKTPGLVYTDFRTGKQYGPGQPFDMPVISEDEYEKVKDDWKTQPAPHGNCFPGYFLVKGNDGKLHNMFRGVDLGFGGYVFASPGMYLDGAQTEDVASEHPHSIKELNLFGEYTQRFVDLMDARIFIKHKDYESAKKLFDGKLAPYLDDPNMAKALSGALKIAINSVYGLTSASFTNAFRDPRNINNIVALRGALFMKTVQDEVEAKGYHVIHIKTDSIKIEHPDEKIISYVEALGQKFGYTFEVEHIWDRLCLVNNAVFIGRHSKDDPDGPGEWDAVGTQFQIPYVYKTLFTHDPIDFDDLCVTKTVQTALYLDFNEGLTRTPMLEELEKLRRSHKKLTKSEERLLEEHKDMSDEVLHEEIMKGHDYSFVGKVGSFVPMKAGCGGGELVREAEDRYGNKTFNAATGAKWIEDGKEVNRWKESSVVRTLKQEDDVDRTYFRNLVDDAKETIEQFGSYEALVS